MVIKNKGRGFTLIEILIVITIVIVLAAIMFPVFVQARESAKRASCISNLKQLTTAALIYMNDYDDVLCPPVQVANLGLYPWTAWYGELTSATTPVDMNRGLLAPYLKNKAIFDCPSVDVISDPVSLDHSYGMNDHLCATAINIFTFNVTLYPVNFSDVQISSETILFGDCAKNEAGPIVARRAILQFNPRFINGTPRGFLHARHISQTAGISWLDGHVKHAPLSYHTRNDNSIFTAKWEKAQGLGDLLKFPREYANPTGTAPSLRDMYYYLPNKELDSLGSHNTVTDYLLL